MKANHLASSIVQGSKIFSIHREIDIQLHLTITWELGSLRPNKSGYAQASKDLKKNSLVCPA